MIPLLLACAAPVDSSTAPLDIAAAVTGPGPFGVGYHEDSVAYDAPDGPRALRLAVWYPTEATDGAATNYDGFFPATDVYSDATIAGGPFPVAVFSHGHQGYAENSGFLMEHLASHGWIVAAPDHTGNTTFDPDVRTTSIYFQRPLDISAVLDALDGITPVTGHLDPSFILGIGHSFGGYTTFALAGGGFDVSQCPDDSSFCSTMTDEWEALFSTGFLDPRLGAFVAMAPGDYVLFGADGLAAIDAPVLHMTASEDQPPGSEADEIWAAVADGDDLRVVLEGGGHQSFTDYADTFEDVSLSAEEGFRIVDAYVYAWAEHQRGDDTFDGVLDGTVEISGAATLDR